MTKRCAVPNCRTGSRTEKKYSVFRAPRDEARLKKWEEAIPGNVKLIPTDVVCEKHFDAVDIAREWIKLGVDGQVIARAVYKIPHLRELAVPTRFSGSSTGKEHCVPLHEYAKPCAYLPDESPVNQNQSNVALEYPNLSAPVSSKANDIVYVSPPTQRTNVDIGLSLMEVTSCEPPKAVLLAPENESNLQLGNVKYCVYMQENPPNIDYIAAIPSPTPGSSTGIERDPPPVIEASSCKHPVPSASAIRKSSKAPTSQEISELEPETNAITDADFSGYVPEFWCFGKIKSELACRILFSYTVTKVENGIHCPVPQKSVTLNANGTLEYFVYGRHVDLTNTKLNHVLFTREMLPNVLNGFRGTNVCGGLGEVSCHFISDGSAYQDYVGKWRSKDCTLLSQKKRCNPCIKLKKCTLQRASRLVNRTTIYRVDGIAHPVIKRKVSAMRAKIRRERRQKLRAKERVRFLMECLKTKEA